MPSDSVYFECIQIEKSYVLENSCIKLKQLKN